MIKQNIYKILYIISLLLFFVFIIMLCIDYANYNPFETSAPFYAFVIVRLVEFVVPSILLLLIGKIIKKKYSIKGSWIKSWVFILKKKMQLIVLLYYILK